MIFCCSHVYQKFPDLCLIFMDMRQCSIHCLELDEVLDFYTPKGINIARSQAQILEHNFKIQLRCGTDDNTQ